MHTAHIRGIAHYALYTSTYLYGNSGRPRVNIEASCYHSEWWFVGGRVAPADMAMRTLSSRHHKASTLVRSSRRWSCRQQLSATSSLNCGTVTSNRPRRYVCRQHRRVCVWRCCNYFISALIAVECSVPASDAAPRRLRLRSANLNRLTVPRWWLSTYGCRAFYHAGSTVWNSLPDELRNSNSFDGFKRFLKQFFSAVTSVTSVLEVF